MENPVKPIRATSFSIFIMSVLIMSFLSGCSSIKSITGNVIADKDKCINGDVIEKVLKGETMQMCCFSSSNEEKEIEVCNSFDFDYSETTIFDNFTMSQRKITYPQGKMTCTDVYGRLPGEKDLALIEDMSTCEIKE